ncbi:hypothetical protein ACTQ1O_11965 [Bilifractor sp. LCP21S3_A7]|uniref:hypothetical protein n=1 Tax=Bilifractor sp. LCP21S3_A7 TaxID=3438738 RepID=UPI003F8E56D1
MNKLSAAVHRMNSAYGGAFFVMSLSILRRCFFRDAIIYDVGSLGKLRQSLQQLHPYKQKSLPMQLLPDKIAATCETGGSVLAKVHNKKKPADADFQ